ncbi:MAG: hypothetical protein ABIH23_13380, partial [bacterium]
MCRNVARLLMLFLSIVQFSLAFGADVARERATFISQLEKCAVEEIPCTTATVQADEVILPASWCLSLGEEGCDPAQFITEQENRRPWIEVVQPGEICDLLVKRDLIPDLRKGRRPGDFAWLAKAEWWLINEFYWPAKRDTTDQTLVLDRLIGATGIWLNGHELDPVEDEFTQVRCNIDKILLRASRNRLAIRITASEGQQIIPPNRAESTFFQCGLGGTARVVTAPVITIEAVGAHVSMADDFSKGIVDLDIRVRKRLPGEIKVHTYATLRLPDVPDRLPLHHWWGQPETVQEGENRYHLVLEEENPLLWRPIGAG